MNTNKVYKYHQDAGHGWLAVKRHELIELGILDKITSYSYQNGQTVYLEEDQDYSTFFKAFLEKNNNVAPKTKSSYYDKGCPVRYYQRFSLGGN